MSAVYVVDSLAKTPTSFSTKMFTSEKKHECSKCGKFFIDSYTLIICQIIMPYECSECRNACRYTSSLASIGAFILGRSLMSAVNVG